MKTHLVTLFSLLLILSACSQQDLSDLPPNIRDLENLTVFPAVEDPPTIELTVDATFGSTDEVTLGQVFNATVDDEGRVYMYDRQQSAIIAFNADGSYLTTIGRQGSGPGEYQLVNRMTVASNNLYVIDPMLQRINLYSLDTFDHISSMSLMPENIEDIDELTGLNLANYTIRHDGTIMISYQVPFTFADANAVRPLKFFAMDSTGNIQPDKLLEQIAPNFMVDNSGSQPTPVQFPFNPIAVQALGTDDQIFSSPSDDFVIRVHDRNGNYERSFYHPFDRRPVDRQELLELYPNETHQRIISTQALPDFWPAIRSLQVDDSNRLWISTYTDSEEGSLWWVLEESGELIGTFIWPGNKSVQAIKGGYVYTRETLESGESVINRYRADL